MNCEHSTHTNNVQGKKTTKQGLDKINFQEHMDHSVKVRQYFNKSNIFRLLIPFVLGNAMRCRKQGVLAVDLIKTTGDI